MCNTRVNIRKHYDKWVPNSVDYLNIYFLEKRILREENDNDIVVVTKADDDICTRKNRRRRQRALAKETILDYAESTTLHGPPYMVKSGVTSGEKIFWLITFIISFCLCSYLIHNVWIKWQTSPVIVTINEALVPVTQVPFPSVTICPQLKVKASVFNYSAQYFRVFKSTLSGDEFERSYFKYTDVATICRDSRFNNKLKNGTFYHRYYPLPLRRRKSVGDAIMGVAPNKDDIFVACIWGGKLDPHCSQTVTEVLTSEGLCYNINSLAADDILQREHNIFSNTTRSTVNWSMEGGYSSFGPNVYPARGQEFGAAPDLEIIFQDNKTERDPGCNSMNTGFNKVFIQHTADFPQSTLHYYAVRNGQVSSLALSFNIISTSKTLEKYTAETRQCYFPKDRQLMYFKIYTESNCMMECFANITKNMCNCVAFYMPHRNNTPVCYLLHYGCVNIAREKLAYREENNITKACKCLPSCYSVEYSAVALQSNFEFEDIFKKNSTKNYTGIEYSKLEVYYKSSRFISMHRSELFGITDLLANTGGLLGLFLGFSFLSLIELIYFLTIRLLCALGKDLKREKVQRRNTTPIRSPKY